MGWTVGVRDGVALAAGELVAVRESVPVAVAEAGSVGIVAVGLKVRVGVTVELTEGDGNSVGMRVAVSAGLSVGVLVCD